MVKKILIYKTLSFISAGLLAACGQVINSSVFESK